MEHIIHTFKPVFNEQSRVLILGTIPSPKSRENGFYYSHPQNRFWRVMSDISGDSLPCSITEKTDFLLNNHIALWDVLSECDILGADDSSIKNPLPNDLSIILNNADIKAVFCTGKRAHSLYAKLCEPNTKLTATYLPSTSPANCAVSYEKLLNEYSAVLKYLK